MQATPDRSEIQRLVDLFRQERLDELKPLARAFADKYPGHGLGWMLLAAIHKSAGHLREAVEAQSRAIAVMPPSAELHGNLGNFLAGLQRLAEAEASYQQCLHLDPRHVNGLYNYGKLLLRLGRPAEAQRRLQLALQADPSFVDARYQLAVALLEQRLYAQAQTLLEQVLAAEPGHADARDSLSCALLYQGRPHEAIAAGDAAVQAQPEDPGLLGNLVFTLNYAQGDPAQALAMAQRFGALVARRRSHPPFRHEGVDRTARRLRVGLVSGDFKNHPVAYFLLPLLAHLDPARLECVAYATTPFEDAFTREIRSRMAGWRDVSALDDAAAARLVHDDRIDVLIDLAGHSGHGRLGLFAYKPAPLQLSWLGYFATTGVAEIDCVLADPVGVPPGAEGQFTERVVRLPQTRLCFAPPADAPEVSPLPALAAGAVTYGCYQNIAKVNDDVLRCWGQVLAAVPGARLRWQCLQFAEPRARERVAQRLAAAGLAADRVALTAGQSRLAYLEAHRHVDMILDTFPFPGGTTTCEALWMGVPTLTLAGSSLLSRQGASLLSAAGLASGWVARDRDAYLKMAADWAGRLPELARLRAGLRAHVQGTALFDGARFARQFEQCLLDLWTREA